MALTEQTIDDLSDRFEDSWDQANCGVPGIKQFLMTNGYEKPFDPALLTTLIIMDIERSWLSWHNYLKSHCAAVETLDSIDHVMARFTSLPTLGSYAELIEPGKLDEASKTDIVEHEARARGRWGDAIGPEFYRSTYGVETEVSPSSVSRYVLIADSQEIAESECARFQLRGLNRLGRQRSFDQRALTCERLVEGNRITISDDQNVHISRHQLTIQLLSPGYVLVTNTGRNGSVLLADAGELATGQSCLQAIPCDLVLARCHLRIR